MFGRENGLSLVLAALFLTAMAGQTVSGYYTNNEEKRARDEPPDSFGTYVTSGAYGEAVFENGESEFLQMGMYVLLTVFLFQRGSAESKDPDKQEPVDEDLSGHKDAADAPGPVRKGGLSLALYKHSLSLAFLALFAASFVGHAVTGAAEFNEGQVEHGEPTTTALGYLSEPQFWFESFQNWQSEFLAVLAIVLLSIRLREHGSPESKPVWKPHHETGNS